MHTLTKNQPYQLADTDILVGEGDEPYVLRVRDLPLEDKPREKLLAAGPGDLTHAELLAVLFGVGTRKEEVMEMAQRVLREYGERAIINEKSPKQLAETLDIPLVKACQIVASFELGRRAYSHRAGKPVCVRTARQAFDHLKNIGHLQKEQLRGLYLSSRYEVIHEETISIGSLTANIVHPREVFGPALEHGAAAIIIAHNHPSGVCDPTEDDLQATNQLAHAGEMLGITLLDHLIIAGDHYMSVMEKRQ